MFTTFQTYTFFKKLISCKFLLFKTFDLRKDAYYLLGLLIRWSRLNKIMVLDVKYLKLQNSWCDHEELVITPHNSTQYSKKKANCLLSNMSKSSRFPQDARTIKIKVPLKHIHYHWLRKQWPNIFRRFLGPIYKPHLLVEITCWTFYQK
jgi:hypothetical protein